jgi:low temperature requirement protein LtrA
MFNKPLPARDHTENHRPSTSLELLYDLVSVVAIAFAATGLHHAINENHISSGLISFSMIWMTIWWAWMQFTWFASSYDSDDISYRISVFIQMSGYLVLAAGVKMAFDDNNFNLILLGYIMMRLPLVYLWLRVSKSVPEDKQSAIFMIFTIIFLQLAWIILLVLLPKSMMILGFIVLIFFELLLSYISESKRKNKWHKHHMIERYGLLAIIVLGESFLSLAKGITLLSEHFSIELLSSVVGGFLILFSMWWIYFQEKEHPQLTFSKKAFIWGYGHYFIFGSIAVVGVGLAVNFDYITEHAHISELIAALSVSIPIAIFLLSLWVIHDTHEIRKSIIKIQLPITALFIILASFLPYATLLMGMVLIASIIVRERS